MIPVTTELFVEAENGEKYVLCRKFERRKELALTFHWIRPKQTTFQLLNDKRFSFPNAWTVNKPMNQLFHVPLSQLLTKGLYVEHYIVSEKEIRNFIMPMGNFDHN